MRARVLGRRKKSRSNRQKAARHFVFSGSMKKISYASGLEGKQVIPIQALTCLLYVGVGLIATLLFLGLIAINVTFVLARLST